MTSIWVLTIVFLMHPTHPRYMEMIERFGYPGIFQTEVLSEDCTKFKNDLDESHNASKHNEHVKLYEVTCTHHIFVNHPQSKL